MIFWNNPRDRCSYPDQPIGCEPPATPAGATRTQNQHHMNKSSKTIITAAAIAGLYLGALAAKSYAADAGSTAPATEKAKDSCKGKDGCSGKKDGKAHDCKGKNECKGKGGCGSSDNGCKGKNSCKGKGGCNSAHAKDDKAKDESKKG